MPKRPRNDVPLGPTPKVLLDQLIQRSQNVSDPTPFRSYSTERASKTGYVCTLELKKGLIDIGTGVFIGHGTTQKLAEQDAAHAYISRPKVAEFREVTAQLSTNRKATRKKMHIN